MKVNVILGFWLYVAVCVAARVRGGYKPILLDLTDNGPCKNDKAFESFDLTDVPQFGAMCSLPSPKIEQYDFLVENNVVPILCMGVYDVFQRLCQTSSTSRIFYEAKDSSYPTSDQFSGLFKSFNTSDKFSSLDKFCSSTVMNSPIPESSSNISQFWWNKLNTLLTLESSCKSVCRTNEDNKVHPLCSFIIWSNQVILKNLSVSDQETSSNLEKDKGEKVVDSAKSYQPKEVETNQILPITGTEEGLKPSTLQTDTILDIGQLKEKKPNGDSTRKSGNLETVSSSIGDLVAPQPNQALSDVGVLGNATKNTVNNSSPDVETQPPTSRVNDSKQTDDKLDGKLPPESVVVTQNQINQHLAVEEKKAASEKITEKSNKHGVIVGNEGKEDAKINPEKTGEEVPDPDLDLDVAPEESEIEQPISDKDIPQTPFTGEEIEDGDGDDIETEVELSKANNNQTVPGNNKPGVTAVDTGVEEPDKAYGEGEVREILIEDHFIEAEDSHFFTYFLCMAVLTIMAYLAFHNKKKLVALALEGRRTRGTRRRPNSSNYSKLDCNLEEALVSDKAASVTHVLY